jgi:hypothetical protein
MLFMKLITLNLNFEKKIIKNFYISEFIISPKFDSCICFIFYN